MSFPVVITSYIMRWTFKYEDYYILLAIIYLYFDLRNLFVMLCCAIPRSVILSDFRCLVLSYSVMLFRTDLRVDSRVYNVGGGDGEVFKRYSTVWRWASRRYRCHNDLSHGRLSRHSMPVFLAHTVVNTERFVSFNKKNINTLEKKNEWKN